MELHFPGQANSLLAMAAGEYVEPVQDRALLKSLSNGKTFFGNSALQRTSTVNHWLSQLAGELHERYKADLTKNQRAPTNVAVSVGCGKRPGMGGLQAAAAGGSRGVS